jgi:hypothetical protein
MGGQVLDLCPPDLSRKDVLERWFEVLWDKPDAKDAVVIHVNPADVVEAQYVLVRG